MKELKKFEEYTIVKKSELGQLGKNWSADYHVNKEKGLKPYIKEKGKFVEVDVKKTIPVNSVYLHPDQVFQYNRLEDNIIELKEEQEKILKPPFFTKKDFK